MTEQVQAQDDLQIRHIRVVEEDAIINNGGATIAYDVDNGNVRYAVAFCCPRDNFSRSVGRNCAKGRHQLGVTTTVEMSLEDFETAVQDLVTTPEVDNYGLSLALNATIGAPIPAAYDFPLFVEDEVE